VEQSCRDTEMCDQEWFNNFCPKDNGK